MRRTKKNLLALIALLLLSACGGGSGSGSTDDDGTPPVNRAPVANAGSDQAVYDGDAVTLDASGSSDEDGDALTYSWTQIAGSAVTLSDVAIVRPMFTAPVVGGGTSLTFEVTIDDGIETATDGVTVTVSDITAAATSVSPETTLGIRENIVVTFGESMNPDSLVLGGDFAAISDGGAWNVDNTTFTLSPDAVGAWESGQRSLSLAVDDAAGNATSVNEIYSINFVLDSFQTADVVIGQTNFTDTDADQGGLAGASTLDSPYGLSSFLDNILWIPDYDNNRILGFDGIPTANGASASYVVGQTNFTDTDPGMSATSLARPNQLLFYNNHYYLLEYDNSRLLVFDSAPYAAPRTATAVLGQADFTSEDNSCTALNFDGSIAMLIVDGKLLVTDTFHHRVLIWNTVPTATGAPPDLVLGQSDFLHCMFDDQDQDGANDATASARTLEFPDGIWSDGTRIVLMDSSNSRVLIWNSFPTSNFQPADIVLGQANFADTHPPGGIPPTASSFKFPWEGVWSNGRQLFISDGGNNRVLVWNQFPTANFQPAGTVLGQSDFVHGTENDDNQDGVADATASARTLHGPGGLMIVRDKLILHESANNRVLVFESN